MPGRESCERPPGILARLCGPSPDDAGFAGMRVNDIRLEFPQEMNQVSIDRKIPDRVDRPAHLIEDDDSISLLRGPFPGAILPARWPGR